MDCTIKLKLFVMEGWRKREFAHQKLASDLSIIKSVAAK